MRLTFGGSVLLAALAAWTCGIPDLAEKKDAAGVCKAKVDCSGCGTCQQSCMCVSAADISACIASCEIDAGVGGSGGSGGSGATDGGVDASSGGEGATGGIQNGGQGGITGGGTTSIGGSGGGGIGGTGGGTSCVSMLTESTSEACSDQCDNDSDQLIDCQDPDCGGFDPCKKTIPCGDSTCDLFTSYCCYGNASVCQALAADCLQTTSIHCAGPADCGLNQVCCGFMLSQPDFHYQSIGCVAPSNCDYASGGRVFCGGDASVCPVTLPCAPSNLVTGYFVCDSK